VQRFQIILNRSRRLVHIERVSEEREKAKGKSSREP
jgi:hypothetical protein